MIRCFVGLHGDKVIPDKPRQVYEHVIHISGMNADTFLPRITMITNAAYYVPNSNNSPCKLYKCYYIILFGL